MRNILLLATFFFLISQTDALAQCPTGGSSTSFYTQADIDEFAINYPNCTQLGNVVIGYLSTPSSSITSLSGLSQITSIGGLLWIRNTLALTDLSGLNNLTSVGGDLQIRDNDALVGLVGLENLTSVGGELYISGNDPLVDLAALGNLSFVGENVDIRANISLSNLTGLENLTSINGDLNLASNGITNLVGLDNINSITGDLIIRSNTSLINLTGLNGLTSIGKSLLIGGQVACCDYSNPSLSSLTGLENLSSVGQILSIINNDALTDLAELNNLTSVGRIDIERNYNLINLMGLNNLTSVFYTNIRYNDNLNSLIGLENLDSIVYDMRIVANDGLTDLTGLNNLNSVRDLDINGNEELLSLTGLENLNSIEGALDIRDNENLTSLAGLENLTLLGGDLTIIRNDALEICNVSIICDYLNNGGSAIINLNAPGCNSANYSNNMEVIASCLTADACVISTDTDSLVFISDNDIFVDAVGFHNNPSVTFIDNSIMQGDLLFDMSLEFYFRLNGSSCEREIAIQLTDPTGNIRSLTTYTTCDGGSDLYYIELPLADKFLSYADYDWLLEFNDTYNQNTDHEFVVKFVRLNYKKTSILSVPNNILNINDQPVSDGTYQASKLLNSIGSIPNSGSVNFKAGECILLDTGFNVDVNADFSAEIDDCN